MTCFTPGSSWRSVLANGMLAGLLLLAPFPAFAAETAATPCTPNGANGAIYFANRVKLSGIDAKVFDVDGVTPLSGDKFLAQLYTASCPDEKALTAQGKPLPFRTGAAAGYLSSVTLEASNIGPRKVGFAQMRSWDAAAATYEQALAKGLRTGKSEVVKIMTGGAATPGAVSALPGELAGLKSFSLKPPATDAK